MSRVQTHDPKDVKNPETKSLLEGIQKKMGKVPNIFRNMANSPAVLQGYIALSEAASHTSFPDDFREEIALTVAQTNNCHYCLSAHTAIAKMLKVPEQDILKARKGEAEDPKRAAILHFVRQMVEKKGHIPEEDINELKAKGITDTELTEIVLLVSLNLFTNYFNHITDPAIDFPEVELTGAR